MASDCGFAKGIEAAADWACQQSPCSYPEGPHTETEDIEDRMVGHIVLGLRALAATHDASTCPECRVLAARIGGCPSLVTFAFPLDGGPDGE